MFTSYAYYHLFIYCIIVNFVIINKFLNLSLTRVASNFLNKYRHRLFQLINIIMKFSRSLQVEWLQCHWNKTWNNLLSKYWKIRKFHRWNKLVRSFTKMFLSRNIIRNQKLCCSNSQYVFAIILHMIYSTLEINIVRKILNYNVFI